MTETLSTSSEAISLAYTKIENVYVRTFALADIYADTLEELGIYREEFLEFLDTFLQNNNIADEDISGTEMHDDTIFIHTNSENFSLPLESLQKFSAERMLGGLSIEQKEEKVHEILRAIESIYTANQGIFYDGEINSEDILEDDSFPEEFQGKTLGELRELYDTEMLLLTQVYSITGDAQSKQDILKREIEFFAGVGDKYEGGARYFSLSQDEIAKKVSDLIENMSVAEVFEYIRNTNETIDSNWRKSDMVNQVNGKLIDELYNQTFIRLQEENAPDTDILEFAKIITGRSQVQRVTYTRGQEQSYLDTSDIDSNYKSPELANRALIYVMYRENGVLDTIFQNNQDIEHAVIDPKVEGNNPKTIVHNLISELNTLAPNTPDYGISFIQEAGYAHLVTIETPYSELNFEDKIAIGALKRISDVLKDSTPEEKTAEKLQEKLGKQLEASYQALNTSFGDAFDGWNGYFGGETADSLGLSGTFGEIFDLYQDINGNAGFFDWSDANQDKFLNLSTATILGVSLIVGAIIFSPVIAAGTSATAGMMLLAGAKAGFATGLVSVALSRQGYDTHKEGALDIGSQIAVDTVTGAIFAWGGLSLLKKFGNLSPNLFWGREAWLTKEGLTEKGFILGEVGTVGFLISPATSRFVRNYFHSSHHDSNTEDFTNN